MQKIHAKEELPKIDARQKQLWTNHWLYLHKTGIFVSSAQNETRKMYCHPHQSTVVHKIMTEIATQKLILCTSTFVRCMHTSSH